MATPVNYKTPWALTTETNYKYYNSNPSLLYFDSKEDRNAYIAENNITPYYEEPMLDEVVVTAKAESPAAKIAVAEEEFRNNPTPENAYRLNDARAMADSYWKQQSDEVINRMIYYDLDILYDRYSDPEQE